MPEAPSREDMKALMESITHLNMINQQQQQENPDQAN